VFLIVVVIAVAMPWPSRIWLQTTAGVRVRLIETEWLTYSQWINEERLTTRVEPPPRRPVGATNLDPIDAPGPVLQLNAMPSNPRAAFVGQWSEALRSAVGRIDTACARYPLDVAVRGPWDRPRETELDGVAMDGSCMLRLHGGQIDLVIVSLDGLPGIVGERLRTTGILDRARSVLTPDGLAVVLLPLEPVEPTDVERWLDEIWRMTAGDFRWTCLRSRHATVLVVAFGHEGGAWASRWAGWSACSLRPSSVLPAIVPAG
jgi:hypothetical protein